MMSRAMWAIPLVYFVSWSSAWGIRWSEPEAEVLRKRQYTNHTCYEDDILNAFRTYSEDSYPFCSTYISLPAYTSTSDETFKTTLTTVSTEVMTEQVIVQVPTATAFVTTTISNSPAKQKRAASESPIAEITSSCLSGANATLISLVSSACTCLSLTNVFYTTSTFTSTRTISGEVFDYAFVPSTALTGTTTTTVTVDDRTVSITPTSQSSSTLQSSAVSLSSPSGVGNTTSVASSNSVSQISAPSSSLSETSSGSSGLNTSSPVSATTSPVESIVLRSSGTASISPSYITSVFPGSTVTYTIFPTPSSSSPAPTIVNTSGSSTSSISRGVVSSHSNGTSVTSALTGSVSPLPSTGSSSGSVSLSNVTSLSGTPNLSTNTRYEPSSTGRIIPLNSTTSTGAAQSTGTAFPSGVCPSKDGDKYTTHGETFRIQCFIDYPGPSIQGLREASIETCMDGCAIANQGFSEERCFAVSYNPYETNPAINNCLFKTYDSSHHPIADHHFVSGLLLNASWMNSSTPFPNPPSNTSSIPASVHLPTVSMNSTAMSPGPTASINSRGMTSGSVNATSMFPSTTASPSASRNITTLAPSNSSAPSISMTVPVSSGNSTAFSSASTAMSSVSMRSQTLGNGTSSMSGTGTRSPSPTTFSGLPTGPQRNGTSSTPTAYSDRSSSAWCPTVLPHTSIVYSTSVIFETQTVAPHY